ncbi:HGxxPAAW family protein [Streptomyces flavochromogenes]|uniref:HGxxPAAW family protein n=1 Tax=Streptomyces flavochromogenes TaxID=68199 RepID=A0ABW6XZR7_9ACTN|nr:HGxxPAAW family protein [Streptomyces flavochromogenes]
MSAHGDVDLGHTLAGWTGTTLAGLGSAVAGAGICLDRTWALWLGAALAVLAATATWTLHLTGWGKPSGPRPADQWDWRVRDSGARHGHPDCLGCRLAGRPVTVTARTRPHPEPAPGRP